MANIKTVYEVWYYDPRGAWRCIDEWQTIEQAREFVKVEKLVRWRIIKVITELVERKF